MRKLDEHDRAAEPGFSLIELLIVIVVLGILATITVVAVRGVIDRGEASSCADDGRRLRTAAESYFAQFGGDGIRTSDPAVPGQTGTTAEGTLVAVGLLADQSSLHDVSVDGLVTSEAASRC